MTNMNQHTPDTGTLDFERGMNDGYKGFTPDEGGSEDYRAGYAAGDAQWADEVEAAHYAAEADDYYYSDVEQGMYDDDPSPYAGDYSEM